QPGQDVLARWLLTPASPAVIAERHAAVAELTPALDLRERLTLEGDAARQADRLAALRAWAVAPPLLPTFAWLALGVTICGLLATATWAIWSGSAPTSVFVLLVLAQSAIVLALHRRVHGVIHGIGLPLDQLALMAGVLRTLEAERFEAPAL